VRRDPEAPSRPSARESAPSAPVSDPSRSVLEVDDLTVELPVRGVFRPAVDRVSFTLAGGEGLAVVGESGSGKTQLARAILGLSPDGSRLRGSVRYRGRELAALSDAQWAEVRGREIGMVFQEPASALDPVRTIGEHLEEALALHERLRPEESRRRCVEALEAVAFPDPVAALEAYPHRLSGGLRQRAGIAIALAPRPRVLLADEPTASLDATVALEILELLDGLRSEGGLAVLLITHDLGAVLRHCDRVLVLYAGRVVEETWASRRLGEAAHPYSKGLLRSAPRAGSFRVAGERYQAIPGFLGDLAERPARGCGFAPRCPERFAPCEVREPQLYPVPAGRARCFLFEPGSGAGP
jgi:peptide/nickel transport system ATP-binding protein